MKNLFVKIRRLIKRRFSDLGTSYEAVNEYRLVEREDESYYYVNDKGDIIDPSL